MRILYPNTFDSTRKSYWSGLSYYKAAALEARPEVDLRRLWKPYEQSRLEKLRVKWKSRIYNSKRNGRQYHFSFDPKYMRGMSARIDRAIENEPGDMILTGLPYEVAYVKDPRPIVSYYDHTIPLLLQQQPHYLGYVPPITEREMMIAQGALLHRLSAMIFSSQWAADNAVEELGVDPEKVHVVPYGANLDEIPSPGEMGGILAAREASRGERLRFLFVGADWQRKGGNAAVETIGHLNALGLPSDLHVVGCQPDDPSTLPATVKLHGRFSKDVSEEAHRLRRFFLESDYFLLLPEADFTPLVYAEAAASGLPVFARDVGGTSAMVAVDRSGLLFDRSMAPREIAQAIKSRHETTSYRDWAWAAFTHYQEVLSWERGAGRLVEILQQVKELHPSSISSRS